MEPDWGGLEVLQERHAAWVGAFRSFADRLRQFQLESGGTDRTAFDRAYERLDDAAFGIVAVWEEVLKPLYGDIETGRILLKDCFERTLEQMADGLDRLARAMDTVGPGGDRTVNVFIRAEDEERALREWVEQYRAGQSAGTGLIWMGLFMLGLGYWIGKEHGDAPRNR